MPNREPTEANIRKITGFAGAKFNERIDGSNEKKSADNPLRKLFDSTNNEMFEGSESFTWISRDQEV